MITGLEGAYLLCNLGILENAAFIKLSEGLIFPWGTGLWGGAEGAARAICAEGRGQGRWKPLISGLWAVLGRHRLARAQFH